MTAPRTRSPLTWACARAEAIGVQETCGVFFFLDPQTDRVNLTLVHPVSAPANIVGPATEVDCWLDLGTIVTTEPEFLALPSGVGVQLINDTLFNPPNSNVRAADGYLGFNKANVGNNNNSPANDTTVLYGGVILFDGAGRLVSKRYAFKTYDIPDPASANKEASKMGLLLYKNDATKAMNVRDVVPLMSTSAGIHPPRSQFGFILFDNEAFRAAVPPAVAGTAPNTTGRSSTSAEATAADRARKTSRKPGWTTTPRRCWSTGTTERWYAANSRGKTRISNVEIRNNLQGRNAQRRSVHAAGIRVFCRFEFRIRFGFRISDFGFPAKPASDFRFPAKPAWLFLRRSHVRRHHPRHRLHHDRRDLSRGHSAEQAHGGRIDRRRDRPRGGSFLDQVATEGVLPPTDLYTNDIAVTTATPGIPMLGRGNPDVSGKVVTFRDARIKDDLTTGVYRTNMWNAVRGNLILRAPTRATRSSRSTSATARFATTRPAALPIGSPSINKVAEPAAELISIPVQIQNRTQFDATDTSQIPPNVQPNGPVCYNLQPRPLQAHIPAVDDTNTAVQNTIILREVSGLPAAECARRGRVRHRLRRQPGHRSALRKRATRRQAQRTHPPWAAPRRPGFVQRKHARQPGSGLGICPRCRVPRQQS